MNNLFEEELWNRIICVICELITFGGQAKKWKRTKEIDTEGVMVDRKAYSDWQNKREAFEYSTETMMEITKSAN